MTIKKAVTLSVMIVFISTRHVAADRVICRREIPQEQVEPPYTKMQKVLFWCGVIMLVVAPIVQEEIGSC